MSADILRRAASLMRERAEVAKPGPWNYLCSTGADTGEAVVTYSSHDLESSLTVECGPDGGAQFDCEHFASWHPAVALAVADWLEEVADMRRTISGLATYSGNDPDGGSDCFIAQETRAFDVARAYLGESA